MTATKKTVRTWITCPECRRSIPVDHPPGQPRFTMPVHGATPEMTCRAGDKVYRMKSAN